MPAHSCPQSRIPGRPAFLTHSPHIPFPKPLSFAMITSCRLMHRHILTAAFAALISTLQALALPFPAQFTKPPQGPDRSLNTWLLGVWETTAPSPTNPAAPPSSWSLTLAPRSSDTMAFTLRQNSPSIPPQPPATGTAWTAGVGDARLLILHFDQPENPALPALTLGWQLLDPLTLRLRPITLSEQPNPSSPFALRTHIRREFRQGRLFATGLLWKKSADITWPRPPTEPALITPTRNLPPPPRPTPQNPRNSLPTNQPRSPTNPFPSLP